MNIKDLYYLLCSHLIIADEEINDIEIKVLENHITPSSKAREEQAKIFSDKREKISVEELLIKIKTHVKPDNIELLELLYKISYADGIYALEDKRFLDNVISKLNINHNIHSELKAKYDKINNESTPHQNWSESLKAAFSVLIESMKGVKTDDAYNFLSGASFTRKVVSIAKKSRGDLGAAEYVMRSYNTNLQVLFDQLSYSIDNIDHSNKIKKNKEVNDFKRFIDNLKSNVLSDIQKNLDDNDKILNKKKRTINYYTIAFMGRTKSGKSTLHKVITKDKDDDIGHGKQRTTRYNRSWHWENIRIVDTPGIGAPGGKTDTETAKEIIDEADLICYIVTNDSIQETEFDFLDGLKERNKPIYILLNVKENLTQNTRIRRFIKQILHANKGIKDNKDLNGFYERIKDMVGDKYDWNAIKIIPLQLLAAQIAQDNKENRSEEEIKVLLKGSNIKEFIHEVKSLIFKTGHLQKTQNIILGCSYQIYSINSIVEEQLKELIFSNIRLQKTKKSLIDFISSEKDKAIKAIDKAIDTSYKELNNNADEFTNNYYNLKSKEITKEWNSYESNKNTINRLQLNLEIISDNFEETIKDRINEAFADLEFHLEQQTIHTDIAGAKIVDRKYQVKVGGIIASGGAVVWLGLAGTAKLIGVFGLANIWNPAGWGALFSIAAVAITGGITYGVSKLFSSKAKKIHKAQKKIYNAINNSLRQSKTEHKKKIRTSFIVKTDQLINSLRDGFDTILDGLGDITSSMNQISDISVKHEQQLNNLYAYRIIEHLGLTSPDEDSSNILETSQKIKSEYNFEKATITIYNHNKKPNTESVNNLSKNIQTKILFS